MEQLFRGLYLISRVAREMSAVSPDGFVPCWTCGPIHHSDGLCPHNKWRVKSVEVTR